MEKQDLKPILGFIIATIIIIVVGVLLFVKDAPNNNSQKTLINSNTHTKGAKDGKVLIVEFSDFECPACIYAEEIVGKVMDKYSNKVKFAYRHYPLPMHQYSRKAAQAAEAAAIQGKFWEMKSIIFKNNSSLKPDDLIKYAKDIGLDIDQFKKDQESDKIKEIIENDIKAAQDLGVEGTPTFFINEEKIFGVPSFEEFQNLIEKNLN